MENKKEYTDFLICYLSFLERFIVSKTSFNNREEIMYHFVNDLFDSIGYKEDFSIL